MTKQDPSEDKRLFLLDAYALIYRAYFAFGNNQMVNSKGMNTSAIFGFANTLINLLEKEKPSHIAVAFDLPGETIRVQEYTEYKANREAMPEDLSLAIPYIQQLIEAFRIPMVSKEGYEADDVIGTLAKRAEKDGYTTYMVTPDKDYGQLVSDKIYMYKPARSGKGVEVIGPKEVCEKYGLERPEQFIDILGLWGDKIDNIPGVPGVGEKTAAKFIQQYGSVENLYEHTDELKGKMKEKVEANKEQALLSKKLATIIIDVPLDLDEEQLIMEEPDAEKITELFSELEFRTLAKRVLGQEVAVQQNTGSAAPKARKTDSAQMDMFASDQAEATEDNPNGYATLKDTEHAYQLVDDPAKRKKLIAALKKAKIFCVDTETTSLNVLDAELIGLAFAWEKGKAAYVPMPEKKKEADSICKEFAEVLDDPAHTVVAHNMKYDLSVLKRYGLALKAQLFDTMIAHYLLQPDMRHGMDLLAETYLGYSPVSITELIGKKGKNQGNMKDVPVEKVVEYAAEDADVTLQLYHRFAPELEKIEEMELFNEVEMPLIPVLADMELEGISLDIDALRAMSKALGEDILRIREEIREMAGVDFNLNSPKQLGDVLFDEMEITPKPKKTGKTKQYSTSEDVLSKLQDEHPIIEKILDYRGLSKLRSTYVDALPELVHKKTGRIHTSFNQAVAATGRLSSNNPNLQNIPIRTERGREVRKAFVPRDAEHTLLAADYSQIELRIIASLSEDSNMVEAFNDNLDIHAATAAKVFGVKLDEVSREQRSSAKAVNFGIIYGQTAFGLAQNLSISRSEAQEIIDSYFKQYPGIKEYMDSSIDFAKEHGYVKTMMGRRRYLRDINSNNATVRGFAERNAINAPIQGTAADMIKVAMIRVHQELEKQPFRSKLLLQVHDELVFDAQKDELDDLKTMVDEKMRHALELKVPIIVGMDTGNNWLEAH